VEGDIENIDGVIRIVRIRVKYHLKIPSGTRERAQRALDTHQQKCPAAMSVAGCIDISLDAEIEEE
jgi:organic hydroperoxide reductase OsmC/OhrA